MRARLAMLDEEEENDLAAAAASLPELSQPELPQPELPQPGPTPFIPAAVLEELLLEPGGQDDADDKEGGEAAV